MKKNLMIVILMLVVFTSMLSGATSSSTPEMSLQSEQIVRDFLVSISWQVSYMDYQTAQTIEYELLNKMPDYIVIRVGDYYYIIPTFE
ncbi:MAG: hypothetical protein KAS49_03685 [Candidatus Cloacimonetes bacterium]|nr:hypothetical protein [Candidatus Cloacimonadota bacterium]